MKPLKKQAKKPKKYATCYDCFPPKSGKHFFLRGIPVHTRIDCSPGMLYFIHEKDYEKS